MIGMSAGGGMKEHEGNVKLPSCLLKDTADSVDLIHNLQQHGQYNTSTLGSYPTTLERNASFATGSYVDTRMRTQRARTQPLPYVLKVAKKKGPKITRFAKPWLLHNTCSRQQLEEAQAADNGFRSRLCSGERLLRTE